MYRAMRRSLRRFSRFLIRAYRSALRLLIRVYRSGHRHISNSISPTKGGAGSLLGRTIGLTKKASLKETNPEIVDKLRSFLMEYHFENTGIRAEKEVEKHIWSLTQEDVSQITSLFESGNKVGGVSAFIAALDKSGVDASKLIALRRLESFLRIHREGYQYPETARVSANTKTGILTKKVLYVLHMRYPIVKNGYVSRSKLILQTMQILGISVTGITRMGFPSELKAYRSWDIEKEVVLDGCRYLSLDSQQENLVYLPLDDYIERYAKKIVDTIKAEGYDTVHAASNFVNGLAAVHAARETGIKSIYEARGLWHVTKESKDPSYKKTLKYELEEKLEVQAANDADKVVVLSEGLKAYFVERGVDGGKIVIVPNGIDLSRYQVHERDEALAKDLGFCKDDIVIGYVGSVVEYEGLDDVLKAVSILVGKGYRKVKILIVGDGVFRTDLEQLCGELGISECCVFTGSVAAEDVQKYYSLIDIAPFVRKDLPVTRIVPPLKPMEAMAMEKCVIVSKLPALNELGEQDVSVYQVDPENARQLAVVLEGLIDAPDARAQMGRQAAIWVSKRRSMEAIAENLSEAYKV